jgi:hypothetical protein
VAFRYNNELQREDRVGEFEKHLGIAKEKLSALVSAYERKQHTVVGDLGTKVVEQLVEADAARSGKHFGTHAERHDYANKEFPSKINKMTKRIWFAYGDLGYDGVNGERAKEIVRNLNQILEFFEERFGERIEPKAKP